MGFFFVHELPFSTRLSLGSLKGLAETWSEASGKQLLLV